MVFFEILKKSNAILLDAKISINWRLSLLYFSDQALTNLRVDVLSSQNFQIYFLVLLLSRVLLFHGVPLLCLKGQEA